MKARFLLSYVVLLALLAIPSAWAGFKVPRNVLTMDKLEQAKQEAADSKKSLLILYSDPNSN